MPQIWEVNRAKVGVRQEELIPAWFPSYPALKMKIQRYRSLDYGIKRLQRGGGSDTILLIDFDSLDRDIQQALGDPRRTQHPMEEWYRTDSDAVRYFNTFLFENETALNVKNIEEYIINASVLQAAHCYKVAHEKEVASKGNRATKLYEFMASESTKFQKVLKVKHNVQHTLPSGDRQFREIYDAFFSEVPKESEYQFNYKEIISGKLQNSNARIVTEKVTALLDSLFAKAGSKPNKLKVARRYQAFVDGTMDVINTSTGEMYNAADFGTLSDRSITKWLSKWESKIATYNIRGADRQKLRGDFTPFLEFESTRFAGSLLSVDDRQPPFEYGPSERLWLYNALDVGSNAITATVWGKTKEGMILEFYRQILRNYTQWGIKLPAEIELESSLNSSFKDTFLKEGAMFDYVRMEANNARGKIIENRNRRFRLDLEKEMEGWIGRWNAKDEANQPLAKDTIYKERKYQSYEKLVQQSLSIIEDWNNMPHPTKKEMSCWDFFISNQNPQLHPTNWRAILPHLGFATKTSCRVGKIRLQGLNLMIADNGEILFGESLINRLKRIEGQDVTVYWIDGNDSKIMKALVYLDDTFICEGIPVPKPSRAKIERNDEDEVKLQIQARYTATVEGYMKNRKQEIEEVVIINHKSATLNGNFSMPQWNRQVNEIPIEDSDFEDVQILEDNDELEDSEIIDYQSPMKNF